MLVNLILRDRENEAKKELATGSITRAQKNISEKYFGEEYTQMFHDECLKLGGSFGASLSIRGSKGSSTREIRIKDRTPSDILSNGEQKIIALADFLSETRMSEMNRGIIFDDPVTSLDEERKSIIAKRLVDESIKRQVIIFTHDLVFVHALYNAFEEEMGKDKRPITHWIEVLDDRPGRVWENASPSLESKYKNAEQARKCYQLSQTADPSQREQLIKDGFSALRSSYEALLIFDLLNGVVRRFDERVRFDCLKNAVFDLELRNEVIDGFENCCKYMEGHLHSDKYAATKPTITNLNEEIIKFEALRSKIKKLKNAN